VCEAVVRNTLRRSGSPSGHGRGVQARARAAARGFRRGRRWRLDEVIKQTAMEERLEANGESEDSVEDEEDED